MTRSLAQIQERLDTVSRNFYMQGELDKEHSECKLSTCLYFSDIKFSVIANMVLSVQDAFGASRVLRLILLYHPVFLDEGQQGREP